jgi:ABC-type multidrug transport system fused ATPase/permease subunit
VFRQVPSSTVSALTFARHTALGRTTESAEQTISGIRFVRAFGQEAHEERQYAHAVDASFDLGKTMAFYSGLYQVREGGGGGAGGAGARACV